MCLTRQEHSLEVEREREREPQICRYLPPPCLSFPGARAQASSILVHLDQLSGYEQQLREKERELSEVCEQMDTVERVAAKLVHFTFYLLFSKYIWTSNKTVSIKKHSYMYIVTRPLSCDTPTVRHVTRPLSCDRFRELQEQREEKVHEAEVVRVRLEQSNQHRQLEHLKQLRDNIGEGGEEVG